MELKGNTQQVWIFIDERDHWQGQALSMAILELLRREGCAGGTVLRGIAGFGAHSRIRTTSLVEMSSDLPLVVTFIDRADRVARVLPQISAMVNEGLITVMPVEVVKYTHRAISPFPPHLTVADVMVRSVETVYPTTPVAEIVTLLIDRGLREAPVVDEQQRVVGVITDGDLLRRGALTLPVALQQALPLSQRAAALVTLHDRPQHAADLMTPHPITLSQTTPLAQAAEQLASHDLKRLPVVDALGRLIGMVSRDDLLGTVAEGLRQRPHEAIELPQGAPQCVADVMLRETPTVLRSAALHEVLDLLLATPQRRVVVVDEGRRVAGIITDGDILRRSARRVQPSALQRLAAWFGGGERPVELTVVAAGHTADDVMTTPVVTVHTDAPIGEAIRLAMAERVKRMPVIDSEGRLVGLVGRAGLLRALAHRADQATDANQRV